MRIPELAFIIFYIITPILLTITAYYDLQKEGVWATALEYKRYLSEPDYQFTKILRWLGYSIWHATVVFFTMFIVMKEQGVFFSFSKNRPNASITKSELSTICIHNLQVIFYIKVMLTYFNRKNIIPILLAYGSVHAIIIILAQESVDKAKGYEDFHLWDRCFENLTFGIVFIFSTWTAVSVDFAENIISKVLNQDTLKEPKSEMKLTRRQTIAA
jgi:hypothetical protein